MTQQSFDSSATASNKEETGVTATVLETGEIRIGDQLFKPDALAKKLAHSEKHIATLESENAEHIEKGTALLDRLTALESKLSDNDELTKVLEGLKAPEAASTTTTDGAEETRPPSTEEVAAAAVAQINAQTAEEKAEANLNLAIAKAKEAYGADEFGDKVDAIGKELGMSVEDVISLAKKSPAAWERAFLPAGKDKPAAPDTTGSSTTDHSVQTEERKTKSFLGLRSDKERRAEFKRRMEAAGAKYN